MKYLLYNWIKQMLPGYAPDSETGSAFLYPELLPDSAKGNTALSIDTPHFKHFTIGQLCGGGIHACPMWGFMHPPFVSSIKQIVEMTAQKQMVRIYTKWVIAAVTNLHALHNGPISKGVTVAVCGYTPIVYVKVAVPGRVFACSPFPTVVGPTPINPTPKASFILKGLQIALSAAIDTFFRRCGEKDSATSGAGYRNGLAAGRALLYTSHVNASYQVLASPGLLAQRPDLSCLHYSTNVEVVR